MKLYLAPMEGITGYIFRNALRDIKDCGIAKYFTPFIVPRPGRGLKKKEEQDLLPENNKGMYLVPQILCKRAGDLIYLCNELHERYGYEEFNLNAGCPSGTVVARGRGAGMLADTKELDHFLEELFSHTRFRISVKTRLGISDPAEFERILEIYEKYPLCELIVHARVLEDKYRLPARVDAFNAMHISGSFPLVYNGDITKPQDAAQLAQKPDALMLGRGLISDPALGRRFAGGEGLSADEFAAFYERIYSGYRVYFDNDTPLLYHMKELWTYWAGNFEDGARLLKAIRKAQSREAYEAAVRACVQH